MNITPEVMSRIDILLDKIGTRQESEETCDALLVAAFDSEVVSSDHIHIFNSMRTIVRELLEACENELPEPANTNNV